MSKYQDIINNLRLKTQGRDGIFYYLPNITDFQRNEKKFHDQIHQDEIEVHQLNTVRNSYYHDYFKKLLYKLPQESIILEIGSGSGYDLKPLIDKGYSVIASDISEESIKSIKKIFNDKILYLVADGQNSPLPNNSVAATFMVAAFHHFENQTKALAEIKRVTKKDGLIILAMEPSRFMMWFTKMFKGVEDLRIYKNHSEADETHQGFSKNDLRIAIRDSRLAIYKRVWLTLGFLHYGLEAIYRIFKLKKRFKIPRFIEWVLLIFDEILLKIPIINLLNWHWIVIIKNS
jgi:ubiquinone/menaquinone biosynthesis C-methylase UbiE